MISLFRDQIQVVLDPCNDSLIAGVVIFLAEQDADLVIFLHREAYYNHEEKTEDEIEEVDIIIAKHRNGPTGDLKLAFEKDINCFYGIKNNEQ